MGRATRYVALKIMMAKDSSSTNTSTELAIYRHLGESAHENLMSQHVNMLLDNFEHVGPNGTHCCLVFEAMGPTATSMVDELPSNKPRNSRRTSRYPTPMAKKLLKHALLGLAYLHENGVVHGDFQPGNLLFGVRDLGSISEEEIQHDKDKATEPLHRLDGKIDRWAPQYLALAQSLHEYVDLGSDMTVKVSDLGAGKNVLSIAPGLPILVVNSLQHSGSTSLPTKL